MAAKKRAKKAAKRPPQTKRQKKRPASRSVAPPALEHPVVLWEIRSLDPDKQQAFYRTLFSWKVDANNPMRYGMVRSSTGGAGSIDGGIGGTNAGRLVTFYVQVEDIDACLAKVEALGGKTLIPRSDIGLMVIATFADPEGNEIGLIEG